MTASRRLAAHQSGKAITHLARGHPTTNLTTDHKQRTTDHKQLTTTN